MSHNFKLSHVASRKKSFGLKSLLLTSFLCGAAPAFSQTSDAPAAEPTDEVITAGVFVPNEKRITSEITSVLDEEIFDTIGAGDIASALTRVTGLSLSRGKFVIVRGLNERYASATLNGSPLPSPEPLRRVAPLDLFPTSLLSDVVVQKTYSPQFSGEFGGGAIGLSTKAIPDDKFLDLSISGSFNTETSLEEGLVYQGGGSDWIGFDDGTRDLPVLADNGQVAPGENFNVFETFVIDQDNKLPANFGGRISAGNAFDFDNGQRVGVLATLGYSNDWETRRGVSRTVGLDAGTLQTLNDFERVSTENKIALNGLLGVGYEISEDHSIEAVGLFTRQSSAEVRTDIGFDAGEDQDQLLRRDNTEWIEREVYMGQLLGEHYVPSLNDLEISWRASYSTAGRDAPNSTFFEYEDENGTFVAQRNNFRNRNQVGYSTLDDESLDAGIDFTLPQDIGNFVVEFKAGAAYLDRSRDSQITNFRYVQAQTLPDELLASRVDFLFSDAVVEGGVIGIERTTGNQAGFPDLSSSGLEVFGGYVSADIEVNENLRLAGGLRYEDSEQTTLVDQSLNDTAPFEFEPLSENFLLPAATLTYTFADNWQLRLAASKTINRPQFRELTPLIFVNTETEERFLGNPFLRNSKSTNFDARLEYYFASNQFVTLGGFYKDFTDPIGEFIYNGIGDSTATSFFNAPSAKLYGVEAEFEKRWAFEDFGVSDGFFATKDLVLRSNYTFTDSSVDANAPIAITIPSADPNLGVDQQIINGTGLFEDGQKLQGQSDHLANLQIGIEDFEKNYEATLLLNYSSERIRAYGDQRGRPPIIEQLPLSLDFVFNWDVEVRGGEYELGFKVQNILNDKYEATQSFNDTTIVVDNYDLGTTFAASLKRRF